MPRSLVWQPRAGFARPGREFAPAGPSLRHRACTPHHSATHPPPTQPPPAGDARGPFISGLALWARSKVVRPLARIPALLRRETLSRDGNSPCHSPGLRPGDMTASRPPGKLPYSALRKTVASQVLEEPVRRQPRARRGLSLWLHAPSGPGLPRLRPAERRSAASLWLAERSPACTAPNANRLVPVVRCRAVRPAARLGASRKRQTRRGGLCRWRAWGGSPCRAS